MGVTGSPTAPTTAGERLFDLHRSTLNAALDALATRTYYSAFPESPSPRVYGPDAAPAGRAAFEAWLGRPAALQTPGARDTVGTERSPYGLALGVSYPRVGTDGLDELLSAARAGLPAWRDAGPAARIGVCLEILHRLHGRVFELANAVMHTTGQAFVMAFQAGGTHALDRALEVVAVAYREMSRIPAAAVWEKPARSGSLRLAKTFTVAPVGVGLVVGCRTFPTWNSWPGLFASLACGNPVVVKPHPAAVLPLAITVQAAQQVLRECGLPPSLVTLAAEDVDDGLARALAVRPEVRLVDFTGSSAFGDWLAENARQAVLFAEQSGVNPVVLDSTDDLRGLVDNLAVTLALYSGQMCTTSQNLFVPAGGIDTDQGHCSVERLGAELAAALGRLLSDDARAAALLGAVGDPAVLARLDAAARAAGPGRVVVASRRVAHPEYPAALVVTPAVVEADAADVATFGAECFGPVAFLVRTASTEAALDLLRQTVAARGALTAAVHSTSERVLAAARAAALDVGVALSENLTGEVYVNQSAAFSDFHGTGLNPASTASFTDGGFVSPRFHVVQSRRPLADSPS